MQYGLAKGRQKGMFPTNGKYCTMMGAGATAQAVRDAGKTNLLRGLRFY